MYDDSSVPSKPASQSKRWILLLTSLCTFVVGLAALPFIGGNKWVTIAAGVASLLLAFLSSAFGIKDSGTKIDFGGKP
jgi:hypothetical protein